MGSTVVVTGAAGYLGRAAARLLAARPEVERVIGVDAELPDRPIPDVEFVRVDHVGASFGRMLAQTRADTVVHMSVSDESARRGEGRLSQKERNVFGTLRMMASVQAQPSVRRVVLKSTGAVYGSSPADPAYFSETTPLRRSEATGAVADAMEVEAYVQDAARRRDNLETCVLRLAHVVGSRMRSPFVDYLTAPFVPTVLGYDPRVQVLHADDAVAALATAALGRVTGVINVAADGALPLSAAVRRVRGTPVPMLPGAHLFGRLVPGVADAHGFNDDDAYLLWGRMLDTTLMRTRLGFEPVHTTTEAIDTLRGARRLTLAEENEENAQRDFEAAPQRRDQEVSRESA